jgi:hypothetical protein
MTAFRASSQGYLVPLISIQATLVTVAMTTVDPSIEQVPFADGGATADLGLGIPYLPDMDDVVVDMAQLTIKAIPHPVTADTAAIGSEDGATTVDLHGPARLVGMNISLAKPLIVGAQDPTKDTRVIVSTAEPGAAKAPIFAAPTLPKPSPMYPEPLTGMTLSATQGDAQLTFDRPLAGSRWALSIAAGDKAGELQPVNGESITVRSIDVDAVPTGLKVVIPGDGDDAAPEAVLYENPGPLLPEAAQHEIVFTPLAQRHLQQRLAAAKAQPGEGLLSVPLRLSSTSAGAVGIVSRTLQARYTVNITLDPAELATGGEWAVLPLKVPAHRRPTDGGGTLVAALAGRELDPAFDPPPRTPPASGVTVATRRRVAVAGSMTVAPGATATLTSVRVLAAADRPAETVLEVHGDNAGLPGPLLASVVRKVASPTGTWQEFLLATPVELPSPGRVWCVLRTNDEPVRWFCTAGEAPLLSVDDGASWGVVENPLGGGGAPMLQLFRPSDPGVVPIVECHLGTVKVAEVPVTAAGGGAPEGTLILPKAVLDALAATTGAGKVTTELQLYSRTVMRITVRGLVCAYEPIA